MLSLWQVLLLSLAIYYGVLMPAWLYRKCTWTKQIAITELTLETLPPKVKEHFQSKEKDLRTLGFLPNSLLLWDYGGTGSVIYVWHFEHSEHEEVARLEAVVGLDRTLAPYCFEGVFARFQSGQSIELVNDDYYCFWARKSKEQVYVLDTEQSLDSLYTLHQFACQSHLQRFPDDLLVRRTWTVEERRAASMEISLDQVQAGILRYEPTTEAYRLTIPGAYRLMLFTYAPFSAMIKAEIRQRAEALKEAYQKSKAIK
jgi:hypothetical protein